MRPWKIVWKTGIDGSVQTWFCFNVDDPVPFFCKSPTIAGALASNLGEVLLVTVRGREIGTFVGWHMESD